MELWQYGILIVVGLLSGIVNVMAGGGSVLTVPTMILLGLPGNAANGTNRIAVLAQDVTAVVTFYRRGRSDFRLSASLAACALPGALIGAWIGVSLDSELFNTLLALIMLGVLALMFLGKSFGAAPITSRRRGLGHLLMALAGFWGGFIQIGMGFIVIPILHRVMGLDLVTANIHKAFITATYTGGALLIFSFGGDIYWLIGAVLALGNAAGGYLGARLALAKGESLIKRVLAVAIVGLVIQLLFPF